MGSPGGVNQASSASTNSIMKEVVVLQRVVVGFWKMKNAEPSGSGEERTMRGIIISEANNDGAAKRRRGGGEEYSFPQMHNDDDDDDDGKEISGEKS